jgi:hypothetical protein
MGSVGIVQRLLCLTLILDAKISHVSTQAARFDLAQSPSPCQKLLKHVCEADWTSGHIKTLMMEESISETLVYLNHLKQLSA